MTVVIGTITSPSIAASPIEIVERKGLGHPDTICDHLSEELSRSLSKYYLEHFGCVLHQLSSLWPRPEQALALGWTANLARQYLSLLDAPAACPINPEHVVSIIGRRDTVLPFESGRRQLTQWGVPKANIFEWDRGHFTVPATMIRTREPMERLACIMSVDAV